MMGQAASTTTRTTSASAAATAAIGSSATEQKEIVATKPPPLDAPPPTTTTQAAPSGSTEEPQQAENPSVASVIKASDDDKNSSNNKNTKSTYDDPWHDMLRRTSEFQAQTGESLVSLLMVFVTYGDLYDWVREQQSRHKSQKLTPQQLEELAASPELYQYITGEAPPPPKRKEDDRRKKRTSTTKSSLSPRKRKRPGRSKAARSRANASSPNNNDNDNKTKIVYKASRQKYDFDEMFRRVELYRELYGHARVPYKMPTDPALAAWTKTIRSRYFRGTVDPAQVKQLDDLGFAWKLGAGGIGEGMEDGSKLMPTTAAASPEETIAMNAATATTPTDETPESKAATPMDEEEEEDEFEDAKEDESSPRHSQQVT